MKKVYIYLASLICALAASSHAQVATTDPVGFTKVNLIAGNSTTPPTQLIGLGMVKPILFQGKVSSATENVLNFPANTITAGSFAPVNGRFTHYVEVVNGAGNGIISHITGTAANQITLEDNISSAIVAGTTIVRVRKFWTVGEAFGATNSAGFLGAANIAQADVITLTRPDDSSFQIFYNTTAARWETSQGADATALPIPIDAGLSVLRRGTQAGSFNIVGDVKTGPTALFVNGGLPNATTTVLQNPYPTGGVMLKDSGLFTGNASTGVVAGTSVNNADVVTIQDSATGVANQFFMDTVSGRWKTGFTDASLIKIPENASISITRRPNQPAFNWFAPQPVMALGTEPLPLTLISAVSRKTHGSAGTWDVNLPLTTHVGIEPRSGGTSGNHTVVFSFSGASRIDPQTGVGNPITSANVFVSLGTANIVGSPVLDGGSIIVNLTGVSNAQTLYLQVTNVQAQNGQSFASATVPVGMLVADTNYNGVINTSDTAQTKSASSPGTLAFGNFRTDVTVNGVINTSDTALVKSRDGQFLP